MLEQEALEDDEYWDDQDDISSHMRVSEDARKITSPNYAMTPTQNGLNAKIRKREVPRSPSQSQPAVPPVDNPKLTPTAAPGLQHPLRHSADVTSLKLDLSSPPAPSSTVRGSKRRSEAQQREWASDRSPLQTLEVKLNDISKEEKRARVEEAELLLRESKAGHGGRRASKEVSATPKMSPSTKKPLLEPQEPQEQRRDRDVRELHHDVSREVPKSHMELSYGKGKGEVDGQLQYMSGKPVADAVLQPSTQRGSQQQPSRGAGQTHPAHDVSSAASLGRRKQEPFRESINPATVHSAHDPRLVTNTERIPDENALDSEQRTKRLPNEVRRATSNRQAPVAQFVPSNITRAVSLQQHQPQPSFPDDQDISGSGPMRESNSSHKAALAEATAAVTATGASAATSTKRDSSRRLQKPPPGNVNRGSYSEREGPKSMEAGATQVSASAEVPRFDTSTRAQDPKVEFYYKGMPKQVDVQKSNTQRATEAAGLDLKETGSTGQNNITNRPRQTSVSFKVPFDKARPVNEWKQLVQRG